MRRTVASIFLLPFLLGMGWAEAAECPGHPGALGVSRTIVLNPTEHPRLGTLQYDESLPLNDHEVVLTFDDGPLPPYTSRVLDTLAAECVKATFFLVGRMAQAGRKRPWAPDWLKREGALEEALGRLWFDTNVGDPRSVELLNRVANPAHLVYGTNFAGWDQQDDIKRGAVPPALAGNARRLLRRQAAQ